VPTSWNNLQGYKTMPKQKTHRGAAKRFRLTGTGKVRRSKAYANHILTKKSPKRKRNLRQQGLVSEADAPAIKRLLNG
jgi:large subunit ribosomal protein L35